MATPVYVIVRDRFEQLRRTVSRLEQSEGIDIILLDNQSTYEPTVEYLRSSQHQVIHAGGNYGHQAPWVLGILPECRFGVTDPDIEIVEECPNDWVYRFCEVLDAHQHLLKCGFSLKTDDLPDHYFLKQSVIEWEHQFWTTPCPWEIPIYDAAVDTTLAIYNRRSPFSIVPAVRTGGPYTARHLAWYVDSNNLSEDEIYYREHADREVASWKYSEHL